MRTKLAEKRDVRDIFRGTFVRFGVKDGYKGPEKTILLKEICDKNGEPVTDHLWFNLTKGFAALELKDGNVVEFTARVNDYIKGYKGHNWERQLDAPLEIDYKLSYPTKVRVI